MKLKDRVAIVTGAASGMGEAISKRFAGEGAKVVIADMNPQGIERVVKEIREAGGEALGVICNVAEQPSIDELFKQTTDTYGKLDILVNNAGILDNFYPVGDMSDELWDKVMGVNLKGPFMTTRAAVQTFLKQETPGVIINMASVGGLYGARGGVAYVTSKHALIGMTRNTAAVYHPNQIRCIAIAPGSIETNIGRTIYKPHEIGYKTLSEHVGPSPMGKAEEVANVALFLASDEASFVNGSVVTVDGGWTAF